ncbi:hypothetical protein B0T19DRAFT_421276 [Cercophora scortea]|uniref:Uncharacterized protein n=1 Tax=Cercophora scortea TaxID=314031 RepID=A0AAE0ILS7_9PEZI|nr:hypothetical protein B0T19DRAFT_421276 [Cercophora scortea]
MMWNLHVALFTYCFGWAWMLSWYQWNSSPWRHLKGAYQNMYPDPESLLVRHMARFDLNNGNRQGHFSPGIQDNGFSFFHFFFERCAVGVRRNPLDPYPRNADNELSGSWMAHDDARAKKVVFLLFSFRVQPQQRHNHMPVERHIRMDQIWLGYPKPGGVDLIFFLLRKIDCFNR